MRLLRNDKGPADIEGHFEIFRRSFTFDGNHGTGWDLSPGHTFEGGDEAIIALFQGQDPGTVMSQDPVRQGVLDDWDELRWRVQKHVPFLGLREVETVGGVATRASGNGVGRPEKSRLFLGYLRQAHLLISSATEAGTGVSSTEEEKEKSKTKRGRNKKKPDDIEDEGDSDGGKSKKGKTKDALKPGEFMSLLFICSLIIVQLATRTTTRKNQSAVSMILTI